MSFFLLPVSNELREAWIPKRPEDLISSSSDFVSFYAKSDKREYNETSRNCFALLSGKYQEFDIHCRPKQMPKAIKLEDAFRFFNTMTEYGVIPEKVRLWEEDDGVHCQIPKGAGPNSMIYATLTCYRWLDAHPPLVWQFLRILEQKDRRHPLQILPYLIATHVSNYNHSFISTGGFRASLAGFETALNPTLGLAAKIFFDTQDERGKKEFEDANEHVNSTVGKISQQISPKVEVKNPNQWGPSFIEAPKYQMRKPEDGLHPALYELYTIPNITTEQVEEILSKLFTEESK